jgi:hypothetical protein
LENISEKSASSLNTNPNYLISKMAPKKKLSKTNLKKA